MPGVVRIGDSVSCGDIVAMGSSNVFANGLPITRVGPDMTAGHCFLPTPFAMGATTVFVNGLPVVRMGDPIVTHVCIPSAQQHGGNAILGSMNVHVESGGGAGAIIDNNPVYSVPGLTPPDNVNPTPADDISPADIYVYHKNDIPEEVSAPPPLTTTHELTLVEQDDSPAPQVQQPTYDPVSITDLPDNFNWATVLKDVQPDPMNPEYEYLSFVDFAINVQLSPSYTLLDLCHTAVSHYNFTDQVNQASGLSQKEIMLNLYHHANVILEPLKAQYPNLTITSGFRNKAGSSQHNIGQATDVQFINIHSAPNTGDIYYNRAKNVRDVIDFDQLILEWYGKNPWFHLSSNNHGHRNKVLTQVTSHSYANGLRLLRHD